ncbi:hypothetical protein GCM10011371_02440 [Novosphingobium marinum]|nr:hypothetical protein GCM10011371_02440 [Novosphingobium marinum]
MARGHVAGKLGYRFGIAENLRDMAETAPREEILAVEAGHAAGFLPAMLQRMKPESGHRGRVLRTDDAENAAFLAQLVAVAIKERVCEIHPVNPTAGRLIAHSW